MGSPFVVVLTTVRSKKEANRLATLFLKTKLVACVNVVPGVTSHYSWDGKICKDTEFLLFLKTAKTKLARLEKVLVQNHSYETPEMIVLPIQYGLKKYLRWIEESLRPTHQK
ncbi:MAG: divalent-cation tolerance protein CutA [Deltaproteobacteria bacterium]|nr:divalent-cation tolerance protein CutA [Deltaproteobacteria bacterium]